jgi:proteasome lid subunit RPN8/RPN11
VGVHPLDRDRYEPLATLGGAPKAQPKPPKKPWTAYETWEELSKDEGALARYFEQRAAVLNDPNLDWGPVLSVMNPKLLENREYIGLVNLDPDGKTLRLAAYEASPVETGTMQSDTAFGAVPSDLVAKYARRPALFLYHTHPADPRGSPLPSSHDLSTSVYFSALARFAAHAVISRYGVLVFGLDWNGYKAVNEAKDWALAMLNLSHDVVAAHEAVRSWSAHGLQDYLAFYPRHRLVMFAYPTPEMVGDGRRYTYMWNLESPVDHEIVEEHRNDIKEHLAKKKEETRRTAQKARARPEATAVSDVDIGLD